MQRITISQKQSQLTTLVDRSRAEDVLLLRGEQPAAVLVSAERWRQVQERLESMEDVLAAHELADGSEVEVGVLLSALGIDLEKARVQNEERLSRRLRPAS